jgi:hypothetical protein
MLNRTNAFAARPLSYFLSILFTLAVAHPANGPENTFSVSGSIIDHKGRVFPDVTVHAIAQIDGEYVDEQTRSDQAGAFKFQLAPGDWLIRVDPDELIIRGFSCFPDMRMGVVTNVVLDTFQVIPTRPMFLPPQRLDGKIHTKITFDTTDAGPVQNIRTYSIQSSTDTANWKEITSVSLLASPTDITDPEAEPSATKFYRAVLVEN